MTDEIEALRKELAEAHTIIHCMQDGSLVRDQAGVIERAEARIAEVEKANSEIATEALRDHRELRVRAERAEAALKEQLQWKKLYTKRAKRAEAECKALRAALEIIAGTRQCVDNLLGNQDIARAALGEKS